MRLTSSLCAAAAVNLPLAAAAGSAALQNILKNTHGSDAYHYPTDFTQGIVPIPCHSHNDYWREVPFYTALAAGCISTEADVWLYNDTLYVGHETSALTDQRTLQSLYIDPILDVLKRQNPTSEFVSGETKNGVFDTSSGQTLYFFIDLKTSGAETWRAVIAALQPLRDAGYLTTLKDNKTLTAGPVTVIGTGNTPLSLVGPIADRDYFYDGPLADLDQTEYEDITGLISPIASTDFAAVFGDISADTEQPFNSTQLATLRDQISLAKSRGIGPRYWDVPLWPIRKRNEIWRTLIKEGVALLNADDVNAAAEYF